MFERNKVDETGGAMVKMPKNPPILMKIGDLAVMVFIEVYLKFQVKILIKTLFFLDLLENFYLD